MSLVNVLPPSTTNATVLINPQRKPPSSRAGLASIGRPDTATRLEPLVATSTRPGTATRLEPLVSIVSESKKQTSETTDGSSIRPPSGKIRPLSSRVYMRKTVKKGWIAKGIEEDDDEDRLSNEGSLDSFFDDDFDDTPQEQVLGGFLSCNTLGVESKKGKNDWISGDVNLPKFHCPRCRDHWYGISAFPCDEELARLIREGKWYTGKEGTLKQNDSDENARNRKSDQSGSSNSSHDLNRVGSMKKRGGTGIEITKSNRKIDFVDPHGIAKKNRRISFNLNSNDSELDNSGSSGLLHEDAKGKKNRYTGSSNGARGYGGGGYRNGNSTAGDDLNSGTDMEAKNIESASSASDVNSSSSTNLLTKGGQSNNLSNGSNEKGRGKKNRKSERDSEETNLSLSGKLTNGGSGGGSGKNGGIVKNAFDIDATAGRKKTGGGTDTLSSETNLSGDLLGLNNSSSRSKNEGVGKSGNKTGTADGMARNSKDGRNKGGGGKGLSSIGSSRQSSRASSLYGGGSQRWSENGDGSRKKERELVPGKGFMRASSPSQSEWGDPTHARLWASNTASSSRVSLGDGLNKRDTQDDVEEVIYLPPIKNQSKNPFASFDLPDGFNLTRAFTFSYY